MLKRLHWTKFFGSHFATNNNTDFQKEDIAKEKGKQYVVQTFSWNTQRGFEQYDSLIKRLNKKGIKYNVIAYTNARVIVEYNY